MNTKTVRELRIIAKDKGLHGTYRLTKADLAALLLEQSSEVMPTSPPRASGKEGRRVLPVKVISSPQEMDEFEKEEMKKTRPVVKNRLNKWYELLVDYVPKPFKNAVSKAFSRVKNSILGLYDGAKNTLKDIAEKEAEEEQQREEDVDLTPHEHEIALKGAYRCFVIPGVRKTDIDSYFDQTKPHIKTLIKNQLKEMGPAKIIMILWVIWKEHIMPLIELGPEDTNNAQDLDDDTTGDIYYTRIEMSFNSLMTEFFEASDINDLIQRMLGYIKAQTEDPKFPEKGFTVDKIMHLYINFHRLVLTRGSSYTELPK